MVRELFPMFDVAAVACCLGGLLLIAVMEALEMCNSHPFALPLGDSDVVADPCIQYLVSPLHLPSSNVGCKTTVLTIAASLLV
jgi:hypothetical protein